MFTAASETTSAIAAESSEVPLDVRSVARRYLAIRDAHRAARTVEEIATTRRAAIEAERTLVRRLLTFGLAVVVDGLRFSSDGDDLFIATHVYGPALRPAKALRPKAAKRGEG